jgi:hypothetical protein
VWKLYHDLQRHAYERILDDPLDKVFGEHPCWIRDFTPAPVRHYTKFKISIVPLKIFLYNNSTMREPSFEQFEATSLYCPRCKAAVPVRKKLLLVLPEGDEYEYLCVYCSSSVGTKIDKNAPQIELVIKP